MALLPVGELGGVEVEPRDELVLGQLGEVCPVGDEVDDGIAGLVGSPAAI